MIKPNGLPVLSKQNLEEIANGHTRAFSRYDEKDEPKFSAWKFAAYYLGKKVRFEWLSNDAFILGISVFTDHTPIPIYQPDTNKVRLQNVDKGTILLDKTLETDRESIKSRPRFTLMHECAHQILHQDYYLHQAAAGRSGNVAYSLQKSKDTQMAAGKPQTAWSDEDWLEWQANYLAGALLMPRHRIQKFLNESVLLSHYRYQVDIRNSEKKAFDSLVNRLAGAFGVSPITAKIRLEHIDFKRLPDQEIKKPNLFDFPMPPNKPIRKTAKQRRDEEALGAWEDKYLDPDYIFL